MSGYFNTLFTSGKLMDDARLIIEEVISGREEKLELENRLRELISMHEQALLHAEFEDRKSARLQELDRLKTGTKNFTQNALAYAGILAFFSITAFIISHGLGKMSTEESFIVGNLTGMAAAIAKDIYGYYFGSSKGETDSKIKL
jgi:hypothetical protein